LAQNRQLQAEMLKHENPSISKSFWISAKAIDLKIYRTAGSLSTVPGCKIMTSKHIQDGGRMPFGKSFLAVSEANKFFLGMYPTCDILGYNILQL